MKRIILVLIGGYFIWTGLVYAGLFRDYSDPVKVAGYYYEFQGNREWFLTSSLYAFRNFDVSALLEDLSGNKLVDLKNASVLNSKINSGRAQLEVELLYRNSRIRHASMVMVKEYGKWLIEEIKYGL